MKGTKANVSVEFEECEEVIFEAEGFYFSWDTGEGVIRPALALKSFLGAESWIS